MEPLTHRACRIFFFIIIDFYSCVYPLMCTVKFSFHWTHLLFPLFQGDYDPVKTQVIHLKMNPTAVAEQQRQQEVEALREEVIRLRELHSQDDSSMHNPSRGFSLPPSKEVQGQSNNSNVTRVTLGGASPTLHLWWKETWLPKCFIMYNYECL